MHLKKSIPIFVLAIFLFSAFLPLRAENAQSSFLKLSLNPAKVKQGQTCTVFFETSKPIKDIKVKGFGRNLYLYKIWHKEAEHLFRGFIGVPATLKPGSYKIVVEAVDHDNEPLRIYSTLNVTSGKYRTQNIKLSRKKTNLMDAKALNKEGKILGSRLRIRSRKVFFASDFIRPAKGRLSAPFGVKRKYNGESATTYHKGIDIANKTGTPVRASNGGKVSLASAMKSNGKIILINHGHGVTTIYSHLSSIDVKEGQWVKQGVIIGRIGSTGISSGPHLHFGVSVNNVRVDPEQWLAAKTTLYYKTKSTGSEKAQNKD